MRSKARLIGIATVALATVATILILANANSGRLPDFFRRYGCTPRKSLPDTWYVVVPPASAKAARADFERYIAARGFRHWISAPYRPGAIVYIDSATPPNEITLFRISDVELSVLMGTRSEPLVVAPGEFLVELDLEPTWIERQLRRIGIG
jgi:hypothetical protein